jgi:PCO_ADO
MQHHLSTELEVFPGRFERRYFLGGSLSSLAAMVLLNGATSLGQTSDTASQDKLGWDEFLKLSVPVAQQLTAGAGFSVDEYLYRLASLATRLSEIPDTRLGPYTSVDPRVSFGPSFRGKPFFIIQWRMEPGAFLPPHNHPNASVCTLAYEGEMELRNFEIIGAPPDYAAKKSFRVRETSSEIMTRGRINTLSPTRDNIHCFRSGKEGARGIDISTMHGKMAPFSFLEISDRPVRSENRVYEAVWRPELGQAAK